MFEHPADPYLVLAITALLLWQAYLAAASLVMLRTGNYDKVKIGVTPGITALSLAFVVISL